MGRGRGGGGGGGWVGGGVPLKVYKEDYFHAVPQKLPLYAQLQQAVLIAEMALAHLVLGCWLLCCMQSVCCMQRSVYKDIYIGMNWQNNVISSNVEGTQKQLVDLMHSGDGVRLSFATGECGSEIWAGISADTFAKANIGLLNSHGIQYTVSTGGNKDVFTCSSTSGADTFLNRYKGAQLQGLDFDIEVEMSTDQLSKLMQSVFYLQQKYPELTISFTLASSASTGPVATSINELGISVLTAARNAGLKFVVNLMTMNYGLTPSQWICVVDGNQKCDMGASAIQAAKNLNKIHDVPFTEIALTPMIGMNDITTEIFTISDMKKVLKFGKKYRLAGLHYWSFDRDCQCPDSPVVASSTCSGVKQKPLQYYNLLMGHHRTEL